MKKTISTFALLLSLLATSCNDEAFITPLQVDPKTNETLQWDGGTVCYKANQDLEHIYALTFRWSNNRGYPLTENGNMQSMISPDSPVVMFQNELCDISVEMDGPDGFKINSGYNLYADTVYLQFEISSPFETAERAVRIMPSPGFGHGKISYELRSWLYEERTDTIMMAQIGGPADHDATIILREKGQVVAQRAGQFKPWDKLLSDNIFGRDSFKVDEVRYNPSMWAPELSGEKITYKSSVTHFDSDPLLYDEDVKITVPANSWAKVRRIIKSENYGIQYSLPAISPVGDLENKIIDGVYWLSVPLSYSIETEFGPIRQ